MRSRMPQGVEKHQVAGACLAGVYRTRVACHAFNTLGHSASHVGIYIGSGKFIHAANEKTGVKLERLDAPYWKQAFEGYRSAFAD